LPFVSRWGIHDLLSGAKVMAVDPRKQVDAPRSRLLGQAGNRNRQKPNEIKELADCAYDPAREEQARKAAGRWLKACRVAAGLSLGEMLKRLPGGTRALISNWESGFGRMTPAYYEPWSRAVGLPPRFVAQTLLGFYMPFLYEPLFGERFSAPGGATMAGQSVDAAKAGAAAH
jgi:transcriptional regulator with XRE-family HTH domain